MKTYRNKKFACKFKTICYSCNNEYYIFFHIADWLTSLAEDTASSASMKKKAHNFKQTIHFHLFHGCLNCQSDEMSSFV